LKNDYGTKYEARALNGLEEPMKKKVIPNNFKRTIPYHILKEYAQESRC
jgi:hypothetical protein